MQLIEIATNATISPGNPLQLWWAWGPDPASPQGENWAPGPIVATVNPTTPYVSGSCWAGVTANGFYMSPWGEVFTADISCQSVNDTESVGNYSLWALCIS
jgi:hypothetical protein